jgi:hypothetical protein
MLDTEGKQMSDSTGLRGTIAVVAGGTRGAGRGIAVMLERPGQPST